MLRHLLVGIQFLYEYFANLLFIIIKDIQFHLKNSKVHHSGTSKEKTLNEKPFLAILCPDPLTLIQNWHFLHIYIRIPVFRLYPDTGV